MDRRDLPQRRRHDGRGGHGRVGEHSAVPEHPADPMAEAHVEHPDHQPDVRVDLLGLKCRVDVADVVLPDHRDRAQPRYNRARRNASTSSRSASMIRTPGRRAICGPWLAPRSGMIAVTSAEYRGDQLTDQPKRQRIVATDHQPPSGFTAVGHLRAAAQGHAHPVTTRRAASWAVGIPARTQPPRQPRVGRHARIVSAKPEIRRPRITQIPRKHVALPS